MRSAIRSFTWNHPCTRRLITKTKRRRTAVNTTANTFRNHHIHHQHILRRFISPQRQFTTTTTTTSKKSQLLQQNKFFSSSSKSMLSRVTAPYIRWSSSNPYITSAISAGCILFAADISAQSLKQGQFILQGDRKLWDYNRTLSLSAFGMIYYGGPCKALYFLYDRFLSPKQFITKALIDCCIHTPFLLVPCFYYITGFFKGDNLEKITTQLRKEWFVASTGSVAFWLPMQLICFRYIPQHSRIVYVTFCSFLHKTWLSYLSNRDRQLDRMKE
jgi:protein Mpv17